MERLIKFLKSILLKLLQLLLIILLSIGIMLCIYIIVEVIYRFIIFTPNLIPSYESYTILRLKYVSQLMTNMFK